MKHVAISFILTFCIVLTVSDGYRYRAILHAQNQSSISSKAHIVHLSPAHPGDNISCEGWREQMSFREITNWARTHGLKALRPEGSHEGIRASFVSKHGSKVIIKNLDPLRHYYLWVHFVNYAKLTETDIHALLEIRADRERIAHVSFADAMEKSETLVFDIPCHLTIDGKLTLEFREYSSSGGFFGIWNMALSDSIEPPNIFWQRPDDPKMIEPHSLIDKAGVILYPSVEKFASTDSALNDTMLSPSKNTTISTEKSKKEDIRVQKPGQKIKKGENKTLKHQIEKSLLKQQTTKIEKQKEEAAKKMLEDDRKKDIRAQ